MSDEVYRTSPSRYRPTGASMSPLFNTIWLLPSVFMTLIVLPLISVQYNFPPEYIANEYYNILLWALYEHNHKHSTLLWYWYSSLYWSSPLTRAVNCQTTWQFTINVSQCVHNGPIQIEFPYSLVTLHDDVEEPGYRSVKYSTSFYYSISFSRSRMSAKYPHTRYMYKYLLTPFHRLHLQR